MKKNQQGNFEAEQQWKRYHLNVPDKHDDDVSASSFGFDSPTDRIKAEKELDEEKVLDKMEDQYKY